MSEPQEYTIKKALLVGVLSRLIILITAISSWQINPFLERPPKSTFPIFGLLSRWDSSYFLDIARYGYIKNRPDWWAFRPLYPTMLRMTGTPFLLVTDWKTAYIIAGVLFNTAMFLIALVLLYKLTETLFDSETAFYSCALLSILPGSVFFTAVYSESMFIAVVLGAFWFFQTDRMEFCLLLSLIAGFTRSEGFLLMVPLIYSSLISNKKRIKAFIYSIPIGATLPGFLFYSWHLTGDFFLPIKMEQAWDKLTFPEMLWTKNLSQIISFFNSHYLIILITITVSIWGIITYFVNQKNLKNLVNNELTPYYLFATMVFALDLYEGGMSHARFMCMLFPVIWSCVNWMKESQTRTWFITSLFAGLMTLGTALFINNYQFF